MITSIADIYGSHFFLWFFCCHLRKCRLRQLFLDNCFLSRHPFPLLGLIMGSRFLRTPNFHVMNEASAFGSAPIRRKGGFLFHFSSPFWLQALRSFRSEVARNCLLPPPQTPGIPLDEACKWRLINCGGGVVRSGGGGDQTFSLHLITFIAALI